MFKNLESGAGTSEQVKKPQTPESKGDTLTKMKTTADRLVTS